MKIMIITMKKNGMSRAFSSSKDECENIVMATVGLKASIDDYAEKRKMNKESAIKVIMGLVLKNIKLMK